MLFLVFGYVVIDGVGMFVLDVLWIVVCFDWILGCFLDVLLVV